MAYQEVALTDLNALPGLVASFAAGLGWSVVSDGLQRVITRPTGTGAPGAGVPIRIRPNKFIGAANATSGTQNSSYEEVLVHRDGSAFDPASSPNGARLRSPRFNSGARQPRIPPPTKLHCFGQGLPSPYLHFVVEYAFNSYRHLYIGTLERPDAYGAAEVISSSSGVNAESSGRYPADESFWSGLFSGRYDDGGDEVRGCRANGGVFLPNNPGVLLPFNLGTSAASPSVDSAASSPGAFGGPRDGLDDFLLSSGFSPFSGDNILTPINLYTITGTGATARVRPMGSVRGVRGVNMRNIEPGSAAVVGTQRWRSFPQLTKNGVEPRTLAGPRYEPGTSSYIAWPLAESSFLYGLAALEGNA